MPRGQPTTVGRKSFASLCTLILENGLPLVSFFFLQDRLGRPNIIKDLVKDQSKKLAQNLHVYSES